MVLLFTGTAYLYLMTGWVSIQCVYAEAGMQCSTCGLTRSFEQMATGHMAGLPPGHVLFFLLFAVQPVWRPTLSLLIIRTKQQGILSIIDIVFSASLVATALCLLLLV